MKKKKFSVGLLFVYLVLVIWALTTIYPLIWVVMNSFKDKKQIVSNSFSFPVGALFTLDNYEKAINKFSIITAYRNSLLISCTVAAVVILFAGLASYAPVSYTHLDVYKRQPPLTRREVLRLMFLPGILQSVSSVTSVPMYVLMQ